MVSGGGWGLASLHSLPPTGRGMDQDINIPGLVLVPVVRLAPSHPRPLAARHAPYTSPPWSQAGDDYLFVTPSWSLHTILSLVISGMEDVVSVRSQPALAVARHQPLAATPASRAADTL